MISFAGMSHLGIVTGVCAASKGFDVVGYDPDPSLCEGLSRGRLPISEPHLPELLKANSARIRFTADPSALQGCRLIVLSADVPTDPENRSDLSVIHQFIDTVLRQAAPNTVLVVHSQVPPGFTRALDDMLRRTYPDRGPQLFYQVETLVFGRAVERALRPERFIIGCRQARDPLPPAYAEWLNSFGCPVLKMRYESAELAKISVNMFLASSVCTVNTLAELCEAIGADWTEIVPALTSDRRIGPHAYLKPGLGLAGGNLERDLATLTNLARIWGTDAGVVEAWLSNSRHRRDWVLKTLRTEVLSTRRDPLIAIWGLAYKPDTSSMKNAPVVALLEALDPLPVRAYDPKVTQIPSQFPHVTRVGSALEACQGADVLIVMTPWVEFSSVSLHKVHGLMRGRIILDPFGALDGYLCAELGLRHIRLGAQATPGSNGGLRRDEAPRDLTADKTHRVVNEQTSVNTP